VEAALVRKGFTTRRRRNCQVSRWSKDHKEFFIRRSPPTTTPGVALDAKTKAMVEKVVSLRGKP
jgi:hypothetical protein